MSHRFDWPSLSKYFPKCFPVWKQATSNSSSAIAGMCARWYASAVHVGPPRGTKSQWPVRNSKIYEDMVRLCKLRHENGNNRRCLAKHPKFQISTLVSHPQPRMTSGARRAKGWITSEWKPFIETAKTQWRVMTTITIWVTYRYQNQSIGHGVLTNESNWEAHLS